MLSITNQFNDMFASVDVGSKMENELVKRGWRIRMYVVRRGIRMKEWVCGKGRIWTYKGKIMS